MPHSRRLNRLAVPFICAAAVSLSLFSASDSLSGASAEYLPICNLPKCLNPQVTTKAGVGTAQATAEAKIHPDDAAKWCAAHKPRDPYCAKEQVRSGWIGFRPLYRASADCAAGHMTAIDGNLYLYKGRWEDGEGKGRPRFRIKGAPQDMKWEGAGATVDHTGTFLSWGGGNSNLAAQWDVLCGGAPDPEVK